MNSKKMTIVLSEHREGVNADKVGQTVQFVNVFNSFSPAEVPPEPYDYARAASDVDTTAVALLNYTTDTERNIENYEGFASAKSSSVVSISVYKQEIDANGNALSVPQPVVSQTGQFRIQDYNISNGRRYRYTIYPTGGSENYEVIIGDVSVNWGGWSITELHPQDKSGKIYSATDSDVWVFNFNVETGEQTQTISRNEQQTLGRFPRYSTGRQNSLSGSVSCLLGSQVLPANYIINQNGMRREGGYIEKLPFSASISSNDKVDMLRAWRDIVFSSNPKLLKDRKGQSFIVTLTDASNKPNDSVAYQPDTISFTWRQIAAVDGVQIVNGLQM